MVVVILLSFIIFIPLFFILTPGFAERDTNPQGSPTQNPDAAVFFVLAF
jgi:hypothetical protein